MSKWRTFQQKRVIAQAIERRKDSLLDIPASLISDVTRWQYIRRVEDGQDIYAYQTTGVWYVYDSGKYDRESGHHGVRIVLGVEEPTGGSDGVDALGSGDALAG